MVPFIVLVVLFFLLSGLGEIGFAPFGWWTSLRLALAGMFLLTASAHWGKRRKDFIRMVPPVFPRPDLIVTATGVLEILGAVGLTLPATARYAAAGLCLLLVAMFPANVYAARRGLTIAGQRVPRLIPRTLLQIVFVAATAAVFLARH
jgi:uncharacterized membrane protein